MKDWYLLGASAKNIAGEKKLHDRNATHCPTSAVPSVGHLVVDVVREDNGSGQKVVRVHVCRVHGDESAKIGNLVNLVDWSSQKALMSHARTSSSEAVLFSSAWKST
jgi:hypothetical protein